MRAHAWAYALRSTGTRYKRGLPRMCAARRPSAAAMVTPRPLHRCRAPPIPAPRCPAHPQPWVRRSTTKPRTELISAELFLIRYGADRGNGWGLTCILSVIVGSGTPLSFRRPSAQSVMWRSRQEDSVGTMATLLSMSSVPLASTCSHTHDTPHTVRLIGDDCDRPRISRAVPYNPTITTQQYTVYSI